MPVLKSFLNNLQGSSKFIQCPHQWKIKQNTCFPTDPICALNIKFSSLLLFWILNFFLVLSRKKKEKIKKFKWVNGKVLERTILEKKNLSLFQSSAFVFNFIRFHFLTRFSLDFEWVEIKFFSFFLLLMIFIGWIAKYY